MVGRGPQHTGEPSGGIGGGRRVDEWCPVSHEHRTKEFLDEALVLADSGNEALMGKKASREIVGPVEGREFPEGESRIEVAEAEGVVSAVPSRTEPDSEWYREHGMFLRKLRPCAGRTWRRKPF